MLVFHLEMGPEHPVPEQRCRVGSRREMLLEPWALREGLTPTASGITLTGSDAFLLRAEPLSTEKKPSLWNGDYLVLSDFFPNSPDQREKNQSR